MDLLLFILHQGYLCFHLRLFVSGLVGLSAGLQKKKKKNKKQISKKLEWRIGPDPE